MRDPKSQIIFSPDVTTQFWHCTIEESSPTQLKNTRRMDLASAIDTWTEIMTNGWDLVEHQIHENAA
tara:strand:+ start:344 stop:544 length:201 start_codon:yes stop_codon:yes gene_type:complete